MLRFALALLLACGTTALSGCAIPQGEPSPDSPDEEVAQSEDALALASLYGTWKSPAGAIGTITFTRDAASTFGGLKGRRFEVTLGAGLDVTGVYKLTHGTQLVLAAYDRPSLELAKILGEYSVKKKGTTLTLTKRSDRTVVQTFQPAVVHSAAEITGAAEAYVWPARDPDYVYRTFDSREAAEAWGSMQSDARWLARDGETFTTVRFVSGSNDLWSQELTVDKTTLAIVVTGEH
jgi:hypothetical protein